MKIENETAVMIPSARSLRVMRLLRVDQSAECCQRRQRVLTDALLGDHGFKLMCRSWVMASYLERKASDDDCSQRTVWYICRRVENRVMVTTEGMPDSRPKECLMVAKGLSRAKKVLCLFAVPCSSERHQARSKRIEKMRTYSPRQSGRNVVRCFVLPRMVMSNNSRDRYPAQAKASDQLPWNLRGQSGMTATR
jgi:hypothetical protein